MLSYIETYARAVVPGFKADGRKVSIDERDLALSVAAYRAVNALADSSAKLLRRARLWAERRQTINELSRLSDRVLKDIGIDRYSIPQTVDELLRSREAAPAKGVIASDEKLAA